MATVKKDAKLKKTTKSKKTTKLDSKSHNHPEIKSTLNWFPKKTFELEMTIKKEMVESEYKKVLNKLVKDAEIKGFRKGKAPKNLVESQVGKSKIYEEAVEHLVTHAYYDSVKQHNLRPIINPKIEPKKMAENEDWIVIARACEAPEVKLGNYKDVIKGFKAKSKIWTPDKDVQPTTSDQQKLEGLFAELLKNVEVEISDLLIEDETNRVLSSVLEEVHRAGLQMKDYLKSRGITTQQHRETVAKQAEENLKLEFIIAQISSEEKIVVTDKDIKEFVSTIKDPKLKDSFTSDAHNAYLNSMLRKQKTIDFIKNL